MADRCQITGDRHESDPERIDKRNASGQRQGNEAASALASGIAAAAVIVRSIGRSCRGGVFTVRRGNRVRFVICASMPVISDRGVGMSMGMVDRTDRHRALLPRHCTAVEAERQDDQATEQ